MIAYDQADGSIAARLWWLLRYYGHTRVAVLDGGFQNWLKSGFILRSGEEKNIPTVFHGEPHPEMVADLAIVDCARQDPAWLVVDARTPDRHQGISETIDPVAGRIPGSVNHHFGLNINSEGRYLSPGKLRQVFSHLANNRQINHLIMYCGSGVTSCGNLLALEHAGLQGARLYPGSWSEWIRDADNPIARG